MLLLCFPNSSILCLDQWEAETTDSTSMHQSRAEGETDRRPQ